ncbi:MAG: hypothetical protein QOG15_3720 [Solirubrobacteraceae bacterium]|nr:hypothetical protein [Solirubrobacteraceae bacterium]
MHPGNAATQPSYAARRRREQHRHGQLSPVHGHESLHHDRDWRLRDHALRACAPHDRARGAPEGAATVRPPCHRAPAFAGRRDRPRGHAGPPTHRVVAPPDRADPPSHRDREQPPADWDGLVERSSCDVLLTRMSTLFWAKSPQHAPSHSPYSYASFEQYQFIRTTRRRGVATLPLRVDRRAGVVLVRSAHDADSFGFPDQRRHGAPDQAQAQARLSVPPRRGRPTWHDPVMSKRDLAHVLTALWDRSGGAPEVAVALADVNEAIGRGRGDMRTPLNLRDLQEQGLVAPLDEDGWALTPAGVAWIVQDRELSDR